MKTISEFFVFALSILLFPVFTTVAHAEMRVPSVIGDNMVLQQGTKLRIWGTTAPGEHVTVTFAATTSNTTANQQGHWQTFIGPFKAGGPFALTITGSSTLTFKNVLVGEVWVCSGQSNMEWPLVKAKGGAEAVAQATYPEIRLFTVQKKTSISPLDDVQGHWVITTPEQAAQFSAVGYFFGRELYQRLNVPIGLIHTSWGGTPAEAWTSHDALDALPALKPVLERYAKGLQDLPRLQQEFERALAEWEQTNVYQDPGNKGETMGYAGLSLEVAEWQKMNLPELWETAGLNIDGAVWFRKEVDVPEAWAGRDLVLSLGPIDDSDVSYFNGTRVGATGNETPDSYLVPRRYKVFGPLVRAGRNVIAVRVFDRAGGGGFGAVPGQMSLALASAGNGAVSLDGLWSYKEELALEPKKPDYSTRPEAPPGPHNQNSPSVLYNAMIAPLTPYAIRGAIWYQGESNAGRAYQYRTLFPAMIRNWRSAWGEGAFPFYFVQLANWMPGKADPGESEWAELREAQTMTLREPHTGMAVTIDIGEANDIHPRNKLDVGKRLAFWALAKTYNQRVEPSGPLYDSYSVNGDKVRVRFKHVRFGLKTSDDGPPKGFAVAGTDRKFFWADARIDGDTIVLWSNAVAQPVAFRYAWADNPACNLYNKADLPASPFRSDDWPGVTVGKN